MSSIELQSLSNIATVVGAAVAAVTAVALASLWLVRQRRRRSRRLSISVERSTNDEFYVLIRYAPETRSIAHFVDIGSLGRNPIYLLPRASSERHRKMIFYEFGKPRWPKTRGQWTGGRLRLEEGSRYLSTKFQIVPQTGDAAGWLYIRVYTKSLRERTLIWHRTLVSCLNS